jgi:hypothetical protein
MFRKNSAICLRQHGTTTVAVVAAAPISAGAASTRPCSGEAQQSK